LPGALEASRENHKEAARLLQQVIATEERLLGPQHPELARAAGKLCRRAAPSAPEERSQKRA
jgi:hypothetical protein